MSTENSRAVHITFRGYRNITYTGTLLVLNNLTSDTSNQSVEKGNGTSLGNKEDNYDNLGASYYVIAVVLVYGMSIVMLIASHIKRRVAKVVEDKQIDKYLQDFQIVKERHARDSYKNLKRAVIKKINWEKQKKPTFQNIQKNMLPLIAIGIPGADLLNEDAQSMSSSLSTVDLAAAEQYMMAKDRGKMYLGRKTSNAMTAEYIAAARKYSRDQSPHSLAKMFRERKISRDYGAHGIYAPQALLTDPRAPGKYLPKSTAGSFGESDILQEEDEPIDGDSWADDSNLYSAQSRAHNIGRHNDGPGVRFAPKSQSFQPSSNRQVEAEINRQNANRSISPHSGDRHELTVPVAWYNNKGDRSGGSRSRSPSPTGPCHLSPGYRYERSHSSGSVPGYAVSGYATAVSPRESPYLSSSPKSTSSILSDGSREELIHITCL